jgi:hypothetical protein
VGADVTASLPCQPQTAKPGRHVARDARLCLSTVSLVFLSPSAARLLTRPPIAPIMRSMTRRVDASEGLSGVASHYNFYFIAGRFEAGSQARLSLLREILFRFLHQLAGRTSRRKEIDAMLNFLLYSLLTAMSSASPPDAWVLPVRG